MSETNLKVETVSFDEQVSLTDTDGDAAVLVTTVTTTSKSLTQPTPPTQTNEWGPYTHPNLRLVDLLRQLSENSFARGESWPGIKYKQAADNLLHYKGPIPNGAYLAKTVQGIGKGIAECIDRMLESKRFTTRDGERSWVPRGDVVEPDEEEEGGSEEGVVKVEKVTKRAERYAKRNAASRGDGDEVEGVEKVEEELVSSVPMKKRKAKEVKEESPRKRKKRGSVAA